jgi:hypothetical protein
MLAMTVRIRRALALGIAALTGCRTISPIAAPGDYIAAEQPASVWVTRADHSVVRVRGPHMLGDTVAGDVANQSMKVALSDVTQVSASHFAVAKTVALVTVWGAALGGGLVYIFSHNPSGNSKNVCLTPNDFSNYCGSILGP